jgi:hypothetical protein
VSWSAFTIGILRVSRPSEEVPLHRCMDATALIAEVVAQSPESERVTFKEGFLERQDQTVSLPLEFANGRERSDFEAKLTDPLVMRRPGKLADVLIAEEALRILRLPTADRRSYCGFHRRE